ncbi:hypothetical protein ACODNH_07355 [Haloarcula sp. NS06]|uniref:hypothetical protein n=1 Tax=unclassified Haloarcula TaxID=2624677 RepID=UPI0027B6C80E|nr:hypothetical protein [Haloarcula sp. H-GB4]MDQ2073234.1 hypothetical protein [Haloarcula sp. H-GB4]
MSESSSLRPRVAGRLQSSAEQAIKRPVKEAVQEVLADAAQTGDGNAEVGKAAATPERHAKADSSDSTDADQSASSGGDDEPVGSRSGSGSRLRSRRTLAFGLVVLGVYLSRRRRSSSGET